MNGGRLSLALPFCLLFAVAAVPAGRATVVTFDEIPNAVVPYPSLTNGYQALDWTNFAALNAITEAALNGTNGSIYGMVSPSNVVFNLFGNPAEIKARGTNFNFLSAALTGAWRSNLNIEVQGFRSGSLIYDMNVLAAATNSKVFTFDFTSIDRLNFTSYGGQKAFGGLFGNDGTQFILDNLTFEFVPEPSSLLLTIAGALLLGPIILHKRQRRDSDV